MQSDYAAHAQKIGSDKKSLSLVLTKRMPACGDENVGKIAWVLIYLRGIKVKRAQGIQYS